MILSRQLNSVKPVRVVKLENFCWLLTNGKNGKKEKGRWRRPGKPSLMGDDPLVDQARSH
jgi:hypothetical protein